MSFEALGHFTEQRELELLGRLADEIDAKNVVEIGSYVGMTALALHNGKANRRVFCVDTFAGPLEFQKARKPAEVLKVFCENAGDLLFESLIPLWGQSKDWAKCFAESFADLVFIDGDHRFEAVCQDAVNWWRVLRPGGLMIFHDTFVFDGVNKALQWLFGQSKGYLGVRDIQTIRYPLVEKPRKTEHFCVTTLSLVRK